MSPNPQIAKKRLPVGKVLHSLKDWGDSAMRAKCVKEPLGQIIITLIIAIQLIKVAEKA
jgi:hypothetical protein